MHTTSLTALALSLSLSLLALTSASPLQPAKRFVGGWCGVHLRVSSGSQHMLDAEAHVYDGAAVLLANPPGTHSGNGALTIDIEGGGLPRPLRVAVSQDSERENVASFEYGDDAWGAGPADSQNSRCKVGKWDHASPWDEHETVDLDCGFSC
ncbi:hypothetical protein AAE478_008413 [Parahypoxylon ruwenzoriense]